MNTSHKVVTLGLSSLLFFGCTASPEVEYVRVTQFQALETKIELLEEDKKSLQGKIEALEKTLTQKSGSQYQEQIDILETTTENMHTDFLKIQEDFEENKRLSATQIKEIDDVLQNLETVKDHYLKNAINTNTGNTNIKPETETLKNSAPEKIQEDEEEIKTEETEKIIDLEAEAQKIRDSLTDEKIADPVALKGEEIEKLRVTFLEEKVSGEQTLLIFSHCKDEICQKYLVEKMLFSDSVTLPSEEGSEILLSGTASFLGEVAGENYFQVVENFSFEEAKALPHEGVAAFESGGDMMDNISQ